jgi:hypothetical protein
VAVSRRRHAGEAAQRNKPTAFSTTDVNAYPAGGRAARTNQSRRSWRKPSQASLALRASFVWAGLRSAAPPAHAHQKSVSLNPAKLSLRSTKLAVPT